MKENPRSGAKLYLPKLSRNRAERVICGAYQQIKNATNGIKLRKAETKNSNEVFLKKHFT